MINAFVYNNHKPFFSILLHHLKKEYKENITMINFNIENSEFQKLIKLFNPNKVTYESIIFYTKNVEPLKEMVNSDFNIFIFNSLEEATLEINKLKERDISIINEYLNSKSINKNPTLKPQILKIMQYINNFPNITYQDLININSSYKEIITLLSLVSIKKNIILLDTDNYLDDNYLDDNYLDTENKEVFNNYPLSLLSEIIEITQTETQNSSEIQDLISLYNLPHNIEEYIDQIVKEIVDKILKHWTIFYTGNKKEVKQYLVPINTDVLSASSKIHTEIAKKFIQAEVCNITEMEDNKLPPFKTFGKTYIVQNHDYLSIRTS